MRSDWPVVGRIKKIGTLKKGQEQSGFCSEKGGGRGVKRAEKEGGEMCEKLPSFIKGLGDIP